MHQSETFGIAIARPIAEVYEFLLEPTNFAQWAFVGSTNMRHLGGRDWAVETSVGPRVIRFAERNAFGVLDHETFHRVGDVPHPNGMRVVGNGAGTLLIYTNFKRETQDATSWASSKQWLVTDLLALQSLLEARGLMAPMAASRTVAFSIARPLREVYAFLAKPANFAQWAFAGDAAMVALGNDEWRVETSVGRRIIRFGPRNDFGVLDYTAQLDDGTPPLAIPLRVMGNGEGTELTFTFLQRPGSSDAEWQSLMEWVTADLLALKSLLEAGQGQW